MTISRWAKLFSMNRWVRACCGRGTLTPQDPRSKAPDCLCLFRRENPVDLGSWKLEACRAGPDEALIYKWSRLVISKWICAADGLFYSTELQYPASARHKKPESYLIPVHTAGNCVSSAACTSIIKSKNGSWKCFMTKLCTMITTCL